MTLLANGKKISAATLKNGVASVKISALPVGKISMTAVYDGSVDYAGSTSKAIFQVVRPAATSTSVTSSPNPSTYGKTVTLTAKVASSAGTPTGGVTFLGNGKKISAATLKSGVASVKTSVLPAGKIWMEAVYGGSVDYEGSTSAAISQVVN